MATAERPDIDDYTETNAICRRFIDDVRTWLIECVTGDLYVLDEKEIGTDDIDRLRWLLTDSAEWLPVTDEMRAELRKELET